MSLHRSSAPVRRRGADLVFLETMTDLYELKAAILAARENCDLPVFTFNEL